MWDHAPMPLPTRQPGPRPRPWLGLARSLGHSVAPLGRADNPRLRVDRVDAPAHARARQAHASACECGCGAGGSGTHQQRAGARGSPPGASPRALSSAASSCPPSKKELEEECRRPTRDRRGRRPRGPRIGRRRVHHRRLPGSMLSTCWWEPHVNSDSADSMVEPRQYLLKLPEHFTSYLRATCGAQ